MKKAYTLILIGMVLIYLNLPSIVFSWFPNVCGYLLIFIGIFLLNKEKPNKNLELSKSLCIGLLCFEILKQGFYNLVGNNSSYAFLLILTLFIVQFFIFYLIIRAAVDETESLDIQTYQQAYLITAISGIILYILTCFFSGIFSLLMGLQVIEFCLLCYIFYYLRTHIK